MVSSARVRCPLQGLTKHATVIKRPMDLGTVLKKVKGQQYKDKKSFAADLELIWTNCMEYNTLPVRAALHALP